MNNMEKRRLIFEKNLRLMCDNIYYQPPENLKLTYPCIIYNRMAPFKRYANNGTYILIYGYNVTVIDKDPDSDIVEKLLNYPGCTFDRHYVSDNLNHDVFIMYEKGE